MKDGLRKLKKKKGVKRILFWFENVAHFYPSDKYLHGFLRHNVNITYASHAPGLFLQISSLLFRPLSRRDTYLQKQGGSERFFSFLSPEIVYLRKKLNQTLFFIFFICIFLFFFLFSFSPVLKACRGNFKQHVNWREAQKFHDLSLGRAVWGAVKK